MGFFDRRRAPGADRPVLELFSRSDCPLCDRAVEALEPLLAELGLALRVLDVEERPEWEERHGQEVPVAYFGSRKIFKYRVDPSRVRRALQACLTDPASTD